MPRYYRRRQSFNNNNNALASTPAPGGPRKYCRDRFRQKNPLLFDTVLRKIFALLDQNNLKKCRLVCKKWKAILDPLLLKNSMFSYTDNTRKIAPNYLEMKALFRSIHRDLNFTAFRFQLNLLLPRVMDNYFFPYRMTMSQLEINSVLQIDNHILIDNLIGPNVRKLKYTTTSYKHSGRIAVSIETLAPMIEVHLEHSVIVVNKEKIRMAPTKLILIDFQQWRHGQHFSLNMKDIIDFRRLRILHLEKRNEGGFDSYYPYDDFIATVNFSDCSQVINLSLASMTVILDGKVPCEQLIRLRSNRYRIPGEGEDSRGILMDYLNSTKVERMIIEDNAILIDFGSRIEVEELRLFPSQIMMRESHISRISIKKLLLVDCIYGENDFFDLKLLPESLECLHLVSHSFFSNFQVKCTRPVNCPNLKQLLVHGDLSVLQHFTNCNALVDICVDGFLCAQYVNNLPKSLKRLKIREYARTKEYKLCKLDVLALSSQVLDEMTPDYQLDISCKFQADLIMFYFRYCKYFGQQTILYLNEENVEKIVNFKTKTQKNVAFGPVKWKSDYTYENSSLSWIVGKKADYYLLEGDKGRAISEVEYFMLFPLDED